MNSWKSKAKQKWERGGQVYHYKVGMSCTVVACTVYAFCLNRWIAREVKQRENGERGG